jgi:hypothetical protein
MILTLGTGQMPYNLYQVGGPKCSYPVPIPQNLGELNHKPDFTKWQGEEAIRNSHTSRNLANGSLSLQISGAKYNFFSSISPKNKG